MDGDLSGTPAGLCTDPSGQRLPLDPGRTGGDQLADELGELGLVALQLGAQARHLGGGDLQTLAM